MGQEEWGDRLLKALQAMAISPSDAKRMVRQFTERARARSPQANDTQVRAEVVRKIVQRYVWLSTASGAATAAPGVVPGAGTLVVSGTALGDTALCLKFQVDMAMCLAEAYGYDVQREDAIHLAYLVALGATIEKVGGEVATKFATKAGVRMVRQYLKGATLQAIKDFLRKFGVVFTRKAVEKAIPFGIGVGIGAGANYVITKYVGMKAIDWFEIDAEDRGDGI